MLWVGVQQFLQMIFDWAVSLQGGGIFSVFVALFSRGAWQQASNEFQHSGTLAMRQHVVKAAA